VYPDPVISGRVALLLALVLPRSVTYSLGDDLSRPRAFPWIRVPTFCRVSARRTWESAGTLLP